MKMFWERRDGFNIFYVHLHAYKINSNRFATWNGAANEMDVCDLLTQNNYFKHAIITQQKQRIERARSRICAHKKKLFILANNDASYKSGEMQKDCIALHCVALLQKATERMENEKCRLTQINKCGLTFVLHKQWKHIIKCCWLFGIFHIFLAAGRPTRFEMNERWFSLSTQRNTTFMQPIAINAFVWNQFAFAFFVCFAVSMWNI